MRKINKPVAFVMAALMTLTFIACDALNLEENKIKDLEAQVAEVTGRLSDLAEKFKNLEAENRRLTAENTSLKKQNEQLKADVGKWRNRADAAVNAYRGAQKQANKVTAFEINFDSGKLYNNKRSKWVASEIDKLVDANKGKVWIVVKGYSSHDGDAEYNLYLSKERAEGVKHKLHEATNNSDLNIDMVAFGETSINKRMVVVEVHTT